MSIWITDNLPCAPPSGGSRRRVEESIPTSTRGILREPRPGAEAMSTGVMLERLHAAQAEHPFWDNRIFRACAAGALTRDDFRVFFSQYYLYCQSFTRFLAAMMTACENDLHRARLAQNIWEEGGGVAPGEPPRRDLSAASSARKLGVDLDGIDFGDAARFFVREYLDHCLRAHPAGGSAFLSLGTEGIVPRMYGILVDGLLRAGVPEEHLRFFRIHMECDDEHAETLERMMVSYADRPDWFETCHRSMDYALSLRQRFFEQLYESIEVKRLSSICRASASSAGCRWSSERAGGEGAPAGTWARPALPLYTNADDPAGDRLLGGAGAARHRRARRPPSSRACRRGAATRSTGTPTSRCSTSSRGRAGSAGQPVLRRGVTPGDLVFVPRWATHQSATAPGTPDLTVLAFTATSG